MLAAQLVWLQAQDPEPDQELASLTASELMEAGNSAYVRQNFAEAEKHWRRLADEFGENEAVRVELARILPFRAIAKVGQSKFEDALPLIESVLTAPGETPSEVLEQLRFWRGVCLLKTQRLVEAQQAFGEFYAEKRHDHEQRQEAMVLFGMAYLMQGEFTEAESFLADRLKKMSGERDAEARGRIAVLRLHALMEAGMHDAALAHLKEWYPRMGEITQLAAFQSLALKLGAHFLEEDDRYKAITCLQRIWSRDRLLEHQRKRLLDLEERHTGMKFRKARQDLVYKVEGMITRVRREIENFESIENFDSALRLRLAMAYQGLGRNRETGLILEDMLGRLPDDAIVEQASVRLVQNWIQAKRWDKAVLAADGYVERFGSRKTDNLPLVLFLKADALQSAGKYDEAIAAYEVVLRRYPETDMAPKCVFMIGLCHLNADRNSEAILQFDLVGADYAESPLVEDADYWKGMAHSFAKRHQAARDHLELHLKSYPGGRYEADSVFRRAFSLHAIAAYPVAVTEFREFIGKYKDSSYADEARLLLGDGLGALGEIEEAVAAYAGISSHSRRFYEDGQFKIGKALRLTEQHKRLRDHFASFVQAHPKSPRIVEAIYWIGWSHTSEGNVDEARKIYWETIGMHGDDPEVAAIEDVLLALPKLYPGENRDDLETQLSELTARALASEAKTLQARILWAKAHFLSGQAPGAADSAFVRASRLVEPRRHSPRMIADCADGLYRAGQPALAEKLYRGLRKWHPRAVERERAYLGLGRLAMENGDTVGARDWFRRASEAAVTNGIIAEALLEKARLEIATDETPRARETLEKLLASKFVDGRSKALGLLEYGRALEKEGERQKATAYYQRVYVAYGKHADLVAGAYVQRGKVLESLNEREKALQVYEELAGRNDLATFTAEVEMARSRIAALSANIPPTATP